MYRNNRNEYCSLIGHDMDIILSHCPARIVASLNIIVICFFICCITVASSVFWYVWRQSSVSRMEVMTDAVVFPERNHVLGLSVRRIAMC